MLLKPPSSHTTHTHTQQAQGFIPHNRTTLRTGLDNAYEVTGENCVRFFPSAVGGEPRKLAAASGQPASDEEGDDEEEVDYDYDSEETGELESGRWAGSSNGG